MISILKNNEKLAKEYKNCLIKKKSNLQLNMMDLKTFKKFGKSLKLMMKLIVFSVLQLKKSIHIINYITICRIFPLED